MSRIENSAKPIALALMRGEPLLLLPIDQILLSSFLGLAVMRNEFSALGAIATPQTERDFLRIRGVPPLRDWRIWITKYSGQEKEHWMFHYPMYIDSEPAGETGPDTANTQTTTLVLGQLCAHVFSSTFIVDFEGYKGIRLCQIWPPSGLPIDWRHAPRHGDAALMALAESLGRDIPAGDG